MSHVDDGQLNALLDHELEAAEQAAVEAHLSACAICRARLEEARAFLVASGELLERLDGEAAGRLDGEAAGRLDGEAAGRLGGEAAGRLGGEARVGATAREKAIDLPAPAKTVQEPALNIDGRTAKTVATPFFPEAAERIAAQAARELEAAEALVRAEEKARRWAIAPQLAWAATIILAIGVGFLGNEVFDLRQRAAMQQMAAQESDRPPETSVPAATDLADRAAVARSGAGAPAAATPRAPRRQTAPAPGGAGGSAAERRRAAGTRIPAIVRRDKPPSEDLAGVSQGAADAASPPAREPAAAAGAPPVAAEERAGPAVPAQPSPLSLRNRGVLDAAANVRPGTFRTISADSAIRAMSGSIRLIDGMRPVRIEIGPGALVSGADAERPVVRVHYQDAEGRRLVLDQQPGETGVTSVNGLIRGDTLVTPVGNDTRIRWIDRKNFWLSLTGSLSQEEMMGIAGRIR